MKHKIIRALWGDLHGEELKKYSLLATGFFFLIGSWWPLKTLKDSIFINMVGPLWIPSAKIASLTLFFPLVLCYSKLVDKFPKEKLIYFFITVYTVLGLILVYFLNAPGIGISNTQTDPSRLLGWAFYLFCESYVSLFMTLYWSFVNDITTPESAKKGYGLIIFGTQFGGLIFTILGNYLSYDTTLYAERVPLIALISVLLFSMVAVVVWILKRTVSAANMTGYQDALEQTATMVDSAESVETEVETSAISFLDGLRMLLTRPYVMGIFTIICLQEIVATIMGFQMSLLVAQTYTDPGQVNKFLFEFGFAVQVIACTFGLVGTSYFQRRFGIMSSLVMYPLCIGAFILWYLQSPTLWTVFYVMLIAKALGYALFQPAKEALYIPTARSIKYKSKAWIDMFGMRFAKATGSMVNGLVGPALLLAGGIALGLIGIWAGLATIVGKRFNKTVENNELID